MELPLMGESKGPGYKKIAIFDQYLNCYVRNDTRYGLGHSYYGMGIGNLMQAFEW